MHHPNVLFLDEPTLGLDPQTRNHIWEYIKQLNQEKNITMVLTTHYMEEADRLCNRIAIIDHGNIVTMGTPQELKSSLGGDMITLGLSTEDDAQKLKAKYIEKESEDSITVSENKVLITASSGERAIPEILKISSQMQLEILSVNLHKPTLDDVFLHHTGKDIRDSGSEKAGMKKHGRMHRRRR
jgi:ABC-2 type transport system ATP-binding protein